MDATSERCGFFGTRGIVSEASLRQDVRSATAIERGKWFNAAGNAVGDLDDAHFGHLLRYWLALQEAIRPPTLDHLYTKAVAPTTAYGNLLNRHASEATARTSATTVAAQLLAGAPPVASPANVSHLVEDALYATFKTREAVPSPWQWSA